MAVRFVVTQEAPWPQWPAVRIFDTPSSISPSGAYDDVLPLLRDDPEPEARSRLLGG